MIEDEDGPLPPDQPPSVSPAASQAGVAKIGESKGLTAPSGTNGADFQAYIGRGLRAVFDDVAKQPVPDRFLELMKKLG